MPWILFNKNIKGKRNVLLKMGKIVTLFKKVIEVPRYQESALLSLASMVLPEVFVVKRTKGPGYSGEEQRWRGWGLGMHVSFECWTGRLSLDPSISQFSVKDAIAQLLRFGTTSPNAGWFDLQLESISSQEEDAHVPLQGHPIPSMFP